MEQITGMAWVTGYEDGPPIIAGGVVDPMVGTHAALALVAALDHRDRTRRRPTGRGPADRGRHRGDGRTGDPLLGRRHAGRPARRGRRLRCAGDRRRGSRSTGRATRSRPTRVPSGARRAPPKPRPHELRTQGVPAAAVAPAFTALDDPQMQARRFFEAVEHVDVGVQQYPTWPMRMSGGYRRRGGPDPRRRSVSTPTTCCASCCGCSEADLERLRAEHVIGTVPYLHA